MKKRLGSLLLAIVMLCTMLPQIGVQADATSWIKNGNEAKGSDYSVEYAQKLDNIFQGKVSLFSDTSAKFPLGSYLNNDETYEVANQNGKGISGGQCYIYAQAVYYYLFGDVVYHGDGYNYWSDSEKVITNKAAASYDLFLDANVGFGAYLRTTGKSDGTYSGSNGHSLIVLKYDSTSITYLEGNSEDFGGGYICITTKTWSEFNQKLLTNKNRRICHVVQCVSAAKKHDYNNVGVCDSSGTCGCGHAFNWQATFTEEEAGVYKVTKSGGLYLRTEKPYDASTAKSELIKEGTQVQVLGSVTNHVPNKWYKVSYNGTVGYAYHGHLDFVDYFPQSITCTITSPAEYAVVQGRPAIKGKIVSKNYPLYQADAFFDGHYYATVHGNGKYEVSLQGTDIDTKLTADKFTPGEHWITIKVKDTKRSELTKIIEHHFYVEDAECSHTYTSKVTTEATCETNGIRTYTCSKCGLSYQESIPATGSHSWGDWRVSSQATCVHYGVDIRTCIYCGTNQTRKVEALDHSYGNWVVTTTAGCTTFGTQERSCSSCGSIQTEAIMYTGHNYVEGYCTKCGEIDSTVITAYGECGDNLTWVLDNSGVLTISGTGEMYEYLDMAPWSNYRSNIEKIIVEEGVTYISCAAFYACNNVNKIDLPDTLQHIGRDAFLECAALEYVILPGGITKIETCVFCDCNNLKAVYIPQSVTEIENAAFFGCTALENVYFYGDIGVWKNVAIERNNDPLTEANILCSSELLSGWEWVESEHNYTANTDITYEIRNNYANSLSIRFSSKTEVEAGYDNIYIYDVNNTLVGEYTGKELAGISVFVPGNTAYIRLVSDGSVQKYGFSIDYVAAQTGSPQFGTCGENLTWRLDSTGKLTITGTGTMYDYTSGSTFSGGTPWQYYRRIIDKVEIGDGVTRIGNNAFYDFRNLPTISLPDSVTSIGEDVFNHCLKLTDVNLPVGISKITDGMFQNCTALSQIYLPYGITEIGNNAFSGTGLTSVTIPNSVVKIGEAAFWACLSLTQISLSDQTNTIGNYAFNECIALTAVDIPLRVISIGDQAFYGCLELTAIYVDAENPNYASDANGVLFNKNQTVLIQAPGGILGHYTVPDGVEKIGDYAFAKCWDLTEITIPGTLATVEARAFAGCKSLTDVNYYGTQQQWDAIVVDTYNESLTGATIHFIEPEGVPGDLTNDAQITNDDVLIMLWHCLFPEENPVQADVDFNDDSQITNDDVLMLLWHCLFPEQNPL